LVNIVRMSSPNVENATYAGENSGVSSIDPLLITSRSKNGSVSSNNCKV
jgi:hypothetical protein